MPPVEIHPSSLTSFMDCQRRTSARILDKDIADAGYDLRQMRPAIGAVTGTATHAGIAEMHHRRMRSGDPDDWSIDTAIDCGMSEVDKFVQYGVVWDATTTDLNSAQKQVSRQLKVYAQCYGDAIPDAVEESLVAVISPDAVLCGTVDQRVGTSIRDTKTGTRRRANGVQYGAYSLLQRAHGVEIDELIEEYLPRTSLKKPQLPVSVIKHNVAEAERAAREIIDRMLSAIMRFKTTANPWEFLPNPMSQMCTERYCPAHGTAFCTVYKESI